MRKIILISMATLLLTACGNKRMVDTVNITINTKNAASKKNMLWRGMGMVSGNNSSRLLIDYKSQKPKEYQELLELIFGDKGCGIQHLKIEMGADINSSSGTEPCTMRTADEKADVSRGAGFILAADAKKVNPDLTLDMLWWGEPLWIEREGGLKSGAQLPKEKVYENRYAWYRANLAGAYEAFNLKFDFVSATQNERGWDAEWIKYLSNRLKSDSSAPYDFSKIKIVAGDEVGTWNQADLILNDKELLAAVDVIGSHYTCWSTAAVEKLRQLGKEVWFSEGSSPMGYAKSQSRFDGNGSGLNGLNGVLDVANRIITMYPQGKMTLYEFQPVVAAYYDGVTYCHKQLITANTPWSGYYQLEPGFFMTLHFSQFLKPGWALVDDACYGDGHAAGDGHAVGGAVHSYLTACDIESGDWSCVITNTTEAPIEYKFALKNTADKSVWAYETSSWKIKDSLKKSRVKTDEDSFSFIIKPNSIVTLSTLNLELVKEVLKITSVSEKDDKVLTLPYLDDFSYSDKPADFLSRRGAAPLYTSDEGGAFELVQLDGENVLQQKILLDQRACEWGSTPEPVTNFGDDRWFNYCIEIEAKFSSDDLTDKNYVGIGGRYNLPDSGKNGIWLKLSSDGRWNLMRNKQSIKSGSLTGLDKDWAGKWHKLFLSMEGMSVVAKIDDEEVAALTLGGKIPLQGAGRAAIYSYYAGNYFRAVKLLPVGEHPYIIRFDNLDSCFEYVEDENSVWEHSLMDSFKCYKRTVSKGKTGSTFSLEFSGCGFILTGTSEKGGGIRLTIDGKTGQAQKISKTGYREALYYCGDLKEGRHKVQVTILAGSLNIDGLEVLK